VAAFLAREGECHEVALRLAEMRDPQAIQRAESNVP
jgi:hypothetical protein